MKSFLSLALLLALFGVPSWSQTQTEPALTEKPASTPLKFNQSDLKEARELLRVVQLWNKPLDWKEKGASMADIVAHLRQALGDDVTIEARGKNNNLSTFDLPQSPLGPTLSSVASLANAKLWVFPSRLLLAPENLLTPKETSAVKEGMGGEWKESSIAGGNRWNPSEWFQQVALSLVGDDLKERFVAKGLTPIQPPPPPSPVTIPKDGARPETSMFVKREWSGPPPLAYQLPLSDLSPATKEVLQNLLDGGLERAETWKPNAQGDATPVKAPLLAASTIVSFDDIQNGQLQLLLQKVDAQDATKRIDLRRWYARKP